MFSASVGNVRRINPDEVDALLANELTQLSFQDRESMQDEIHGIGTVAQTETPEMVQNAVLAVLEAIQRIPVKRAYETALRRNSTLVLDNQAFFLQFLRAELFDAEKAAVRMLMYLEMVVEYYGEDALLRPMMLCDLGNEEMQLLREGRCQLTSRDRFGRRIICTVGAFGSRYSAYSRVSFVYPFYNKRRARSTGIVFVIIVADVSRSKSPLSLMTHGYPCNVPSMRSFSLSPCRLRWQCTSWGRLRRQTNRRK